MTIAALALSFTPVSAFCANDTFPAQVTLTLCPEYQFGGVTIELAYTAGAATDERTPVITAEGNFDPQTNSKTYDILLPNYYTTIPFNVFAYCRNRFGRGARSNIVSISNCDSLALRDDDGDGIPNNQEDTNCDNFYSPGDRSNPNNVDTDGDGVRDLVELISGTDPSNPGDSPRPIIFSGGPFDPDGDIASGGSSNPVVWRPSNGNWYIRDFQNTGNHLTFQFGLRGDIPFVYNPQPTPPSTTIFSDVGVIRNQNNKLDWYFHGPGLEVRNTDGSSVRENLLEFGLFGDNIVLGPWEHPQISNPAVARLFNDTWSFFIYQSDGSVRQVDFGHDGDVPKVQDYDGDGLFDIAVYRPSEGKTFVIYSSDSSTHIFHFGTGTADFSVRGDFTGDGKDDISFWEPITAMFTTMTSDNGFNEAGAAAKDPLYYQELQLGIYITHVPLNWNYQNGRMLYTVVDHQLGLRYFRQDNLPSNPPLSVQWGLPGDSQG